MHRFYAPDIFGSVDADLPADEAEHLARVLRLKAGDLVAVFDGKGREAIARVERVASSRVTLRVIEPRAAAPEPAVALTLAQALLKSDKMDAVIRDAVMLGVSVLQPLVSARTEVPRAVVRAGGRQQRWQRTVIASVKQCGRAVVPPVRPAQSFQDVISSAPQGVRLMFVEPGGGFSRGVSDLRGLESPAPSSAMILIGPEGGWDPREVEDAAAAGVTLVTFKGATLRADAAGAAAIAVLRYAWRDL